jgi:hypothetical protein
MSPIFSRICAITPRLGCSRLCSPHRSRFPTTELDQGAEHAKHTKACRPSRPGVDCYRPFTTTLPTSATKNPNLPIPIPLPSDPPPSTASEPPDLPASVEPNSEEAAALYGGVPFITRTFSHACPTRASGDATRMHSVLNTFFQTPVSGEEKMRRIQERISCSCLFPFSSF